MLLEVNNLCKKFHNKKVLEDISFTLQEGKVLGILGPNGKGKTTLLNSIYSFIKCDKGSIKIDGINVGIETKKIVSYLQDKATFPKKMTIQGAIDFYNDFFHDFNMEKMEKLLIEMNLNRQDNISDLSKGMTEKLFLSLALSRDSRLFLLDEPISGVDPVAREKIINSIINNISEESSMIITTHYVGELENIFDEVIFIGEDGIVEMGDAEDLRIKYSASIDGIYRKVFAE